MTFQPPLLAAPMMMAGATNVRDYGAMGDDTSDDTEAIQTAISATPSGGTIYLPAGRYRISRALVIDDNCRFIGDGAYPIWGSQAADFNSINLPIAPPWISGTVLVQVSPGENGINLRGAGRTQHISGIAIIFEGLHQFRSTGHGILAVPPEHAGGYDNGLSGSIWENIVVFGHDGDHYGFHITNGIYNDFTSLMAFGGGVLLLDNNSTVDGHYGNTNFASLYGQVFVGGSADGIRLKSTTHMLNLLSFIRPQVTVGDMSETFDVPAPATTSQQMLRSDEGVWNVSMLAFDFETSVGSTITPPIIDCWMDPAGLAPTWIRPTRADKTERGES